MPRNAAATMPAGPTPLEELLDRGRSQGHLSLDEVRSAFQEAGITPTQGRSIIRELTDAGVPYFTVNPNPPAGGRGGRGGRGN